MKEKVERNSRETESTKNITVGRGVEGQEETSQAASVPGRACAAWGEPHRLQHGVGT